MILIAFLLGITSSLHCVGMCGPIALLLGSGQKNTFQKVNYHVFRVLTYGGLITLLAGIGYLSEIQSWQYNISLFSGIMLLLIAWIPKLANKIEGVGFTWITQKAQLLLKRSTFAKGMILGIFNGILPCAFVYAAIITALSYQGSLNRFLFMIYYGLGTIPLLLLLQWLFTKYPQIQVYFKKVLPILLSLVAIMLILRGLGLGIPFLSPDLSPNGADGCIKMY